MRRRWIAVVLAVLLPSGARAGDPDEDLREAAKKGDVAAAESALSRGANVNKPWGFAGITPLGWAADGGYVAVVRMLLEKGAKVSEQDAQGNSALHRAAEKGHAPVVKMLLDAGAQVDPRNADSIGGNTPLMDAGSAEVARLLLAKGADIKAQNAKGASVLMENACSPELAAMLLDLRQDLHATDNVGKTPLMYAASSGCAETVKLFLAKGAQVNAADQDGWTALMWGASCTFWQVDAPSTIRLLLQAGADPTFAAKKTKGELSPAGSNALAIAREYAQVPINRIQEKTQARCAAVVQQLEQTVAPK